MSNDATPARIAVGDDFHYPGSRLLTTTGEIITGTYRQVSGYFVADRIHRNGDHFVYAPWSTAPDGTHLFETEKYRTDAARAALAALTS